MKANSFILCTEQQWKSESRFPRGAHGYLAEMTHQQPPPPQLFLTFVLLDCFCFQTQTQGAHLVLPKAETSSVSLRLEGRPSSSACHGPLSHLFIPCVPWQRPKSNKNPSKDLGKQTKLCTDETSSSGKKRLAWFGKTAKKLISH